MEMLFIMAKEKNFKIKTAVEEGTTTADSLSFKGGMRNYIFTLLRSSNF
jgi:hypothetical protein